jgi:hypothetical protein
MRCRLESSAAIAFLPSIAAAALLLLAVASGIRTRALWLPLLRQGRRREYGGARILLIWITRSYAGAAAINGAPSPSAAAASASRRTPAELSAPPPHPAAAVSRTPIPPVDPLSAPRPPRLGHHRTGSPAKAAMKPEPTDDSPLAACKVTPRTYLCPALARLDLDRPCRGGGGAGGRTLRPFSARALGRVLHISGWGRPLGERNKPTSVWSAARRSPERRLGTNR